MISSSFRSAILTIGDEILIGQVVNSNASYLGKELFSLGLPVERIISVPDRESDIIKEFRSAWKKYDVVIVTGGLGPTHDDITKKCVAKFFKCGFMLDTNVLKSVKQMFSRRKIPMPPVNIGQALVPECAIAVPNKTGTAPGLIIDKGAKTFCVLPGVPYEMKHLCEKGVFPHLKKKFSKRKTSFLKQKTLHTIGIGESLLAKRLGNIDNIVKTEKDYSVKLAFLPSNYEVRLRITVSASSAAKAVSLLKNAKNKILKAAGNYVYSDDEGSIQQTVGKLLKKKRLTISVAESCTGGLTASKLTDVPGSSDYLFGGMITYDDKAKEKFLKVNPRDIKKYGAVSEQVAKQMSYGIRKISGTDIGISTTGIAGPSGARPGKPVGLVWIGYSDKDGTFAKKFIFTKDRLRNKDIMSKMALETVRRKLLKL